MFLGNLVKQFYQELAKPFEQQTYFKFLFKNFDTQNIITTAHRTSEQGSEGKEENIKNFTAFSLFIPPHKHKKETNFTILANFQ